MAGIELYQGLGSSDQFGFKDTAHYVAPGMAWSVDKHSTLKVSPGFELAASSSRALPRMGYTYEVTDFGCKVASLFGAHH